nr:MAG TPA: hypothetical protein [Caudoviricetes sp.]
MHFQSVITHNSMIDSRLSRTDHVDPPRNFRQRILCTAFQFLPGILQTLLHIFLDTFVSQCHIKRYQTTAMRSNKIAFEIVLRWHRNLSSVIQINTIRIFLFCFLVFVCFYSRFNHLLESEKIHNSIKKYHCVSYRMCYYICMTSFA